MASRLQREEKIQDQRKKQEQRRKAVIQKIQNFRGKLRYLSYWHCASCLF